MNYILGSDRSQVSIECAEDYVDVDSEVRVIDKIIDTLEIESLGFKIGNNDIVGRPMFNPRDVLKLFVYGYFNGIRSSRKLAKQARINREVIWLINGLQPKYRVIADFRKENIDALTKVFECFVAYCIEVGLYGKELIAVDGTKLEASASKRNNLSRYFFGKTSGGKSKCVEKHTTNNTMKVNIKIMLEEAYCASILLLTQKMTKALVCF